MNLAKVLFLGTIEKLGKRKAQQLLKQGKSKEEVYNELVERTHKNPELLNSMLQFGILEIEVNDVLRKVVDKL